MVTLKNVLVATDMSDTSRAALERARGLADAFHASLHVLHVVSEPLHEIWACYAPGADFLTSVGTLQQHARARVEGDLPNEDIASGRVTVSTPWGDPSDEILKYARAHDIDLIVCGTHGRRGWDHVLMGSVAERLVRLAPCPVLTVRAPGAVATAA